MPYFDELLVGGGNSNSNSKHPVLSFQGVTIFSEEIRVIRIRPEEVGL